MSTIISTIRMALPYAGETEVKEALKALLDRLDNDLDSAGFDPSTETEDAISDVIDAVNDVNEREEINEQEAEEELKELEETD